VTDRTVAYYQPLIEQEGGHSILGDVPRQNLPVRRYRQWKQLFNPYSWGPLVSSSGQALEVSLSSQDLLSTTLVDVGYGYDANQNTGSVFAKPELPGLVPGAGCYVQFGHAPNCRHDQQCQAGPRYYL
jgi:hypothetical protein